MVAGYLSVLITANIVSPTLLCRFLLISESIIQTTSRRTGAGVIKSYESNPATGWHAGKLFTLLTPERHKFFLNFGKAVPLPPDIRCSSYFGNFFSGVQDVGGSAAPHGRPSVKVSAANVSGNEAESRVQRRLIFYQLGFGPDKFCLGAVDEGGGRGGGIMTAESISTSRDCVRSKSRRGAGWGGGA